MRKLIPLLAAIASLIANTSQAIPLRELIFETIAKEHHGVLTQQEIKDAGVLGSSWFKQHKEVNSKNGFSNATSAT